MPAKVLDACVIIPHFAGEQLYDCLDAVYACPDQPAEVILVDDASVDGTSDVAAERFPGIRRVRNPENLGIDRGSRAASGGGCARIPACVPGRSRDTGEHCQILR